MQCNVRGVRSEEWGGRLSGVTGRGRNTRGGKNGASVLRAEAEAEQRKPPSTGMGTSNKETTMEYEHRTNVLA